jgi:hypothetical protein
LVAAKLVGAFAENCGPCTQLVVDMAQRDGVAAQTLRGVLQNDAGAIANIYIVRNPDQLRHLTQSS